jgi:RimJ/RimL family protein N-acetyltransferase
MVEASAITGSPDPVIREQAGYSGPGSYAFACFAENRIVGICFYWFGDRYRTRNFWPLVEGEAKLVQIVSIPEARGQGIATHLIALSSQDMMRKGFGRAYARIWHSNIPSLRAFERAGWMRLALVIEANPLRRRRPIRICLNS